MAKPRLKSASPFYLNPVFVTTVPIFLLCVYTSFVKPTFLSIPYLTSIVNASVYVGVASLGTALVLMCGTIDLSVGYAGILSAVMGGTAAVRWGWHPIPCFILVMITGVGIGYINGFMIYKMKFNSWVTTLAMSYVCRGVSTTLTQGIPLSTDGIMGIQMLVVTWNFFGFPILVYAAIVMYIILDIIIRKTGYGFKLRAAGGNAEAANMAGINVIAIKWSVFVLAGFFAAMGGLFDMLANGVASELLGVGREFRAIIACAVGGISVTGGSGTIAGAALGVILFHVLWYCLRILQVNTNLQLVLIGVILLLAVVMDTIRNHVELNRLVQGGES
jgi:ribose/xylose/arabinose/galactoside ABC-type transport system permease subunit